MCCLNFVKLQYSFLLLGRIRITKHGPRIFWKKHFTTTMGLGYGGCYVAEYLPESNVCLSYLFIILLEYIMPYNEHQEFFICLFSEVSHPYLWWT